MDFLSLETERSLAYPERVTKDFFPISLVVEVRGNLEVDT
jgi:hypothetical protein